MAVISENRVDSAGLAKNRLIASSIRSPTRMLMTRYGSVIRPIVPSKIAARTRIGPASRR